MSFEAIRAWFALNPGTHSAPDIAAGVGGERTLFTVYAMYRQGMLKRTGRQRAYVYTLVRGPMKPARITPAERKARRAARDKARRQRLAEAGLSRSREKYLAEVGARAAARKAARLAARAERQREAEELRTAKEKARAAARLAKQRAKAKPVPAPKTRAGIVIEPKRPCITEPARVEKRRETVEEWMARTGNQPQTLPSTWNSAPPAMPVRYYGREALRG